jgi:hypothetical protein
MDDLDRTAGAALQRTVASAQITHRVPVSYDPFLAGRTVERVSGSAQDTSDGSLAWQAVVKRTSGPGRRAARRELAAYQAGIAARTSEDSLGAPRLLAARDRPEQVELWLEALTDDHAGRWPVERFGLAARHIAQWDLDRSRPHRAVTFDAEDAWAERHGQPARIPEATAELIALRSVPAAQELMVALDDDGFQRTAAMITSTVSRIERLTALPQTLLHHDLVRSNLFALPGAKTAAIDWEVVGPGPFGVDLAPLVVGSVRRGEASADELPALEDTVLSGYVDVVAPAGISPADVRSAYRLSLGLRWHVVLGTISAWLEPTTTRIRGSRPGEGRAESLRHLVVLSRHLLDAA